MPSQCALHVAVVKQARTCLVLCRGTRVSKGRLVSLMGLFLYQLAPKPEVHQDALAQDAPAMELNILTKRESKYFHRDLALSHLASLFGNLPLFYQVNNMPVLSNSSFDFLLLYVELFLPFFFCLSGHLVRFQKTHTKCRVNFYSVWKGQSVGHFPHLLRNLKRAIIPLNEAIMLTLCIDSLPNLEL